MDAVKRRAEDAAKAGGGRRGRRGRIYISPLCPLPFLCFFLFGRPLFVLAALSAALLHEGGHLLTLLALGGRIERFELLPFGGEIITAQHPMLSYRKSALVSFAGVFVNLLCVPVLLLEGRGFFGAFGMCSAALAFFNLLPARGLDGGEILSDLLLLHFSPACAGIVVRITSALSAGLLAALFVWGALCSLFNPMLILLAVYLLFRCFCDL